MGNNNNNSKLIPICNNFVPNGSSNPQIESARKVILTVGGYEPENKPIIPYWVQTRQTSMEDAKGGTRDDYRNGPRAD